MLPPGVADAIRRREKIEAIKLHRAATGAGLKESKEFIEEAFRRANLPE
jgi:ribosomal protein L7/L12